MKDLSVKFYLADSEYYTALRLVAGAVCSAANIDVDTLEDFKVCVTESALIFKNCGYEQVEATFCVGDGVRAEICGVGGKATEGDNALSFALISALVKRADMENTDGIVSKVILSI